MSALHDLTLTSLTGEELPLKPYEGKVLLIVNVASECGLTPQYAGLEKLQKTYAARGFSVLVILCNVFDAQKQRCMAKIDRFCERHYHFTIPMCSKLEVNGPGRHPLYRLLAGEGAEFPGAITGNFEKFLVGPDGRVLARFAPRTTPDDPQLVQAIEAALD